MKKPINEQDVKKTLDQFSKQAEETVRDPDKLRQLLHNIESKLSTVPKVGEKLAAIPVFVSLLRSYQRKEYTEIPYKSLIAIAGALIYFLAPVDLIPDFIPVVGYVDDAAVLAFVLTQVKKDVDAYKQWRDNNN